MEAQNSIKYGLAESTVEPRYNEGPRDWQNMFVITRFRYIEVLFHIFYHYTKKSFAVPMTSLYRGSLYRGSTVFTSFNDLFNVCGVHFVRKCS